ncbi:hypothetical protein FBZ93_12199 [Bradyrhizobium macuxiense]|uniref:Uncharacterized protein n=1 Tax=Bradyrhizobium macuxiense TaxID=1755647 RepID=A0A560KWB9_9BRAD|nr:hypothetical protein FBZ93_12199 [Bradyrhizobium macuxiense]
MPESPKGRSTPIFRIPKDRLPGSTTARHGALRDYFCDKDADATLIGDNWEVSLYWPTSTDRHVDPRLLDGLAWWDSTVSPGTMAMSRRRDRYILTSLYDTWTLYSWAQWLNQNPRRPGQKLTLLHFDDHRDFGSPRLFATETGYVDAIAGKVVDIRQPNTILDAIDSGAIGMGSFFTLLFHTFDHLDVRHFCQPPKVRSTSKYEIERYHERDTLLDPTASRPAVKPVPRTGRDGANIYLATNDPEVLLADIPADAPILVHIDMDYFNNRYDGDNAWLERAEALNPPAEEILQEIDRVGRILHDERVLNGISDVSVSFSPGFFPAEFWSAADARLRPLLEKLR